MSEFAAKLMASNDDTKWRAGRTIEDQEATISNLNMEIYALKSGVVDALNALVGGSHFHSNMETKNLISALLTEINRKTKPQ